MAAKRESLADYVRRVIHDKDLSYRKVASRAGNQISASTISAIINGRYTDLSASTQAALAKGLGVPLTEVQAILSGQPRDDEEFRQSALQMLYEEARTADPETKRMIDWTIEMLLDQVAKAKARSSGR